MKKLPSPTIMAWLFAILILLLFLSSIGYLWYGYSHPGSDGMVAEIYQNGILVKTIPLSKVTESYSFTVDGKNGAYNIIQVDPDGIGIVAASCPDQLCARQGFIHNDLLTVTCLPNRLVIKLKKEKATTGSLDAITY